EAKANVTRILKSIEEFEGEVSESLVIVDGHDLPPARHDGGSPEIGRSRRRIDATQRVTGRARYTQDLYLAGMLHARILRSPHARARVRRIDTKRAEALPGVRGVLHRFNTPKTPFRGDDVIFREEVRFVGEEDGAVALYDGEMLTVWESTQHVFGVRTGLKNALKLPYSRIRVICDYMGGGFGAKNGVGKYTIVASLFAMHLGKPVRCVLTRDEENLAAGNRSATLQQLRLGAKGGRITAIEHTSWSNSGQGKWIANPTGPTNTLY